MTSLCYIRPGWVCCVQHLLLIFKSYNVCYLCAPYFRPKWITITAVALPVQFLCARHCHPLMSNGTEHDLSCSAGKLVVNQCRFSHSPLLP